MNMLESVQGTR